MRKRVTQKELRIKFNGNEGGYPDKIDSLKKRCTYDVPASPESRQIPGTMSRIYKYFDGDTKVLVVHCFVEPSGNSGRRVDWTLSS